MKLQIVQIEIEICQLRDFVIINAVDILFISVSVCLSDCLPLPSLFLLFECGPALGSVPHRNRNDICFDLLLLPARNHYNNNSKNHFT